MGLKRTNLQRPSSSDSSSSSEEEEQAASPPPAKKPSLNSTSQKTKPSKSPQPPSSDDEEDEDGEPPVSQKKDQKKKEVAVKKDEKKKEEEEGSSDEEESSSDEEEEKQQQEEEEEEDDEGSGTSDEEKQKLSEKPDSMAISASDSDSDSEPSEKPVAAGIVTPAATGTKRPRDSAPSELENTKKKRFQRIWGADDEIKILKGIIAFYSDKGPEPPSNAGFGNDLDAIHSLLKKSLGLEFSKAQLGNKIRGLRRKFQISASRLKNNTDPKLSKPHQQEIYELSKKLWRPENPNEARKSSGKSVKSKGKSLALKVLKVQEEVDIPEGDSCYEFMGRAVAQAGHGGISWSLIKRGLKLVDPEKARPLEKKLRELELARMRHRLQWLDKREEATQLIIDSIAKSG